jgi:hypothetical protein
MSDVYVSQLGDDSTGDGSISKPYKTIETAMKTGNGLTVGGTVWLRGGVHTGESFWQWIDANDVSSRGYTSVVGTDDNNRVYVKSYPGEKARLDYGIHLYHGSNYITFENIVWDNPVGNDRNIAIRLSKQNTEISNDGLGDALNQPWIVYGITIKNCEFRNFTGGVDVIRVNRAEDLNILNNVFDNNRTRISGNDGFDMRFMVRAKNVLISGNHHTDCGADCIHFSEFTNQIHGETYKLFENVIVENNTALISVPHVPRDQYGEYIVSGHADYPVHWGRYCGENYIDIKWTDSNFVVRNNKISNYRPTLRPSIVSWDNYDDVNDRVTFTVDAPHYLVAGEHENETIDMSGTAVNTGNNPVGNKTIYSIDSPTQITINHDVANAATEDYQVEGWLVIQDASGASGGAIISHIMSTGLDIYGNEIIDCTKGITLRAWVDNTSTIPQRLDPRDLNGHKIYSNIIREDNDINNPIALNEYDSTIIGISVGNAYNFTIANNTIDYRNSSLVNVLQNSSISTPATIMNNICMAGTSSYTSASIITGPIVTGYNCWGSNVTPAGNHENATDVVGDPPLYKDYTPVMDPNIFCNVLGAGIRVGGITDFYGNYFAALGNIGALSQNLNNTGPLRFVRPSTTPGTYGDEDGSTYNNAWNGFSNVNWNTVGTGGTLYVCGEHTENFRILTPTSGLSITVRGDYPHDPGRIVTSDSWAIQLTNKTDNNWWTFKNLYLENTAASGTVFSIEACSYIIIIYCTIKGSSVGNNGINVVTSSAAGFGNRSNFIISDTEVTNCGRHGVQFHGEGELETDYSIEDIIIQNCKFNNNGTGGSAGHGLYFRAASGYKFGHISNALITNIEAKNNYEAGFSAATGYVSGGNGLANSLDERSQCYGITIQDSIFKNNGQNGFNFNLTTDRAYTDTAGTYDRPCTVSNSKCIDNSWRSTNGSMENISAQGLIIEYCKLEGGLTSKPNLDGIGLWIDMQFIDDGGVPARRCIYRYNTVINHTTGSISFNNWDANFGGSTGVNNFGPTGIRILGGDGNEVYGNVIINARCGLMLNDNSTNRVGPANYFYAKNNRIYNNTFVNCHVAGLGFRAIPEDTNEIFNNAFINCGQYAGMDMYRWASYYYGSDHTSHNPNWTTGAIKTIDNNYFSGYITPTVGTISNTPTNTAWPTDKFGPPNGDDNIIDANTGNLYLGGINSTNEVTGNHEMDVPVDLYFSPHIFNFTTISPDTPFAITSELFTGFNPGDMLFIRNINMDPDIEGFYPIDYYSLGLKNFGTFDVQETAGDAPTYTTFTASGEPAIFIHYPRISDPANICPKAESCLNGTGRRDGLAVDMFGNDLFKWVGALAPRTRETATTRETALEREIA